MYKVKGKPWAYSGAIDVSDCSTAKEVMIKANLNFEVAKCELVGKMPIKLTGTDEELDRIIKEQKEGAHVLVLTFIVSVITPLLPIVLITIFL